MKHRRSLSWIASAVSLALALAGCGGGGGGGGGSVAATDTTPPVITIVGSNPATVTEGDTYTDAGATAIDDVDGNLTTSIQASGTVDTSTPGTYVITYTVSDTAGNAATPVTRTVTVESAYLGAAKVTGSVSLSNLTDAEAAALATTTGRTAARMAARRGGAVRLYAGASAEPDPTQDATALLYVIGPDGSLLPTGHASLITRNPDTGAYEYSFDGVKDGVSYVVRYLKKTNTGRVFELKVPVKVPEGTTGEVPADTMDKLSTALADMVRDAVVSATQGTTLTDDIVNQIIDSVTAAVKSFVQTIAPTIFQKEMVIDDVDAVAVIDGTGDAAAPTGENTDLDDVTSKIQGDPSYESALNIAKGAANFGLPTGATDAEKKAYIQRLFDEMLEDGDLPSYLVDFMADAFAASEIRTVAEMVEALQAGMSCQGGGGSAWDLPGATAFFNQMVTFLHELQAYVSDPANVPPPEDPDTGTPLSLAAAQAFLVDVPPVFLGLFDGIGWENVSDTTDLDVPHAIGFTILVMDVYLQEDFDTNGLGSIGAQTCGVTDLSGIEDSYDVYDFNPMQPGSMMALLGFFDDDPDNAGHQIWERYAAAGAEVVHFEAEADKAWIPDDPTDPASPWQPHDSLRLTACFSDLSSLMAVMAGGTGADFSTATAIVTYPTSTGTANVDLSFVPEWGDDMTACFTHDPWYEKYGDGGCDTGDCYPDPDWIVSDFVSGTYEVVLTAADASELARKSFPDVRVLTGLDDLRPALLSPREAPWAPDPNPNDPDYGAQMQAQQDAWDAYWRSGGDSRFPVNTDTDGDGTDDAVKVTVSWEAPDLSSLPQATQDLLAGLDLAYALEIGRNTCVGTDPITNDCTQWQWQPLWRSWENDRRIFGTSFTVPEALPKSPEPYDVSLRLLFLDAGGDEVGQGGEARAQFRVDDPIDPDATLTITGTVSGTDPSFVKTLDGADAGVFASLYYETWNPATMTQNRVTLGAYRLTPDTGSSFDEDYTIRVPVSDLQTVPPGAYVGMIMFVDEGNANETWDTDLVNPVDGTLWGEYAQWPDPENNFWLDTWGGVLKLVVDRCPPTGDACTHEEEPITGSATIDGINFHVGAWLPDDWADGDDDGDGLTNEAEGVYGTDPWNWDSDFDMIGDGDEMFATATNPLLDDTDGDGCRDGDEVHASPATDPNDATDAPDWCMGGAAGTDSDRDGLPDDLEADAGTDPYNFDTDGDGCGDATEYFDLAAQGGSGQADPLDPTLALPGCSTAANTGDGDWDGISDTEEQALGTDPEMWDTDGDGCSDGDEVYGPVPSDPLDGASAQDWCSTAGGGGDPGIPMDTDGDGITDPLETELGTNPADPTDPAPVTWAPADLVGTWAATDPKGGTKTLTVTYDSGTGSGTYTMVFVPPMGSPDPGGTETGTWVPSTAPGAIDTTVTTSPWPGDVGMTETLPVVFLDAGHTEVVINVMEHFTKQP